MIMYRSKNGITLVALVVTIVILLILAGITIALLTGENGLIGKSGEAKNATEKSQEKEELEIAVIRFTDKRGNLDATKIVDGLNNEVKNLNLVTATDGKFPVKVEYKNGHKYQITKDGDIMISVNAGDTAPSDSNAAYSSGDYTAIIPAGFTVSGIEGETSIENGLVVKDNNQNEWVWIPVSSTDLSAMYTEDSNGWTMSGTGGDSGIDEVLTKYKSNSRTDIYSSFTRGNIGTNSSREPDILNNTNSDNKEENWLAAGFNSYKDMAQNLKDDYKNMIDSLSNYGGFYVGRYELSNIGVQKKQQPQTGNWYYLYSKCKALGSSSTESRMIWGCQWDQICKFVNTNGDRVSLSDSKTYGNYKNSIENSAVTIDGNKKYGTRQVTGFSEYWKVNNIYDIAGNCREWTQEAYQTGRRQFRGGSYGDDNPITNCYKDVYSGVTYTDYNSSSRPVLYIK